MAHKTTTMSQTTPIFDDHQQALAEKIQPSTDITQWKDWKWQLRHAIKTIEAFEHLTDIHFSLEEKKRLNETADRFPLAITPYYASLIEKHRYADDPVYKQAFLDSRELLVSPNEMSDPLAEDKDSPVPGITHRYPDRVLFLISNTCAMYCRHCTRKRKVGDVDFIPGREQISLGLDYIRRTPQIRDVLLSGGDPFLLSDDYLDWILTELQQIPHVEVIRIGTRTPVVLPYRITDELVAMLKKHQPLWINTHFNHPRELTTSSREALAKLADAGIPLGNQSVLLAGVNDCPRIMRTLVQQLVKNRVRPYYLYQCDLSEGLSHFRTPVRKGIEIMESLIGHTSGFAVPTYVIDAPGGGGKIPVMPHYIISWNTNKVILRNYEGVITSYREPDHYQAPNCNLDCEACKLELDITPSEEINAIGIEKLLSDYDDTVSLIPSENERFERREDSL